MGGAAFRSRTLAYTALCRKMMRTVPGPPHVTARIPSRQPRVGFTNCSFLSRQQTAPASLPTLPSNQHHSSLPRNLRLRLLLARSTIADGGSSATPAEGGPRMFATTHLYSTDGLTRLSIEMGLVPPVKKISQSKGTPYSSQRQPGKLFLKAAVKSPTAGDMGQQTWQRVATVALFNGETAYVSMLDAPAIWMREQKNADGTMGSRRPMKVEVDHNFTTITFMKDVATTADQDEQEDSNNKEISVILSKEDWAAFQLLAQYAVPRLAGWDLANG